MIQFELDDNYGGIPGGERFSIDGVKNTEEQWDEDYRDFLDLMSQFGELGVDFDIGAWHYGAMEVFAFLYGDSLFSDRFILSVSEFFGEKSRCYVTVLR